MIEELTRPKEPISRSEYKKAMSQFWTIRRDIVEACHHLFYPEDQPKNNCPYCWFAFFQVHGDLVQTADECFQKEGKEVLIKVRGKKFVKNFIRFMATLEKMKELNSLQESSETSDREDISREVEGH